MFVTINVPSAVKTSDRWRLCWPHTKPTSARPITIYAPPSLICAPRLIMLLGTCRSQPKLKRLSIKMPPRSSSGRDSATSRHQRRRKEWETRCELFVRRLCSYSIVKLRASRRCCSRRDIQHCHGRHRHSDSRHYGLQQRCY
jgi:hypothetical protein